MESVQSINGVYKHWIVVSDTKIALVMSFNYTIIEQWNVAILNRYFYSTAFVKCLIYLINKATLFTSQAWLYNFFVNLAPISYELDAFCQRKLSHATYVIIYFWFSVTYGVFLWSSWMKIKEQSPFSESSCLKYHFIAFSKHTKIVGGSIY